MGEFIDAALTFDFLQNALLAGILASIACGIMGTYVVVKKIGYITGGIAHAVLGGMGIAYFLEASPLRGAVIASLVSAIIIGLVAMRAKQHEDTIISALWAIGMALGIIFISRSPGYNVDLMSYLFGNILMVSPENLRLILILDFIIIMVVILFYKRFLAVCFDQEHAALKGMKVEIIYLLLLCLIALTVVILIQVVGLILVIALLTLPASVAGQYTNGLKGMMITAVVLGIILTTGGMALSYKPDLPAGATIVLLTGLTYLISLIMKKVLIKTINFLKMKKKEPGYK